MAGSGSSGWRVISNSALRCVPYTAGVFGSATGVYLFASARPSRAVQRAPQAARWSKYIPASAFRDAGAALMERGSPAKGRHWAVPESPSPGLPPALSFPPGNARAPFQTVGLRERVIRNRPAVNQAKGERGLYCYEGADRDALVPVRRQAGEVRLSGAGRLHSRLSAPDRPPAGSESPVDEGPQSET